MVLWIHKSTYSMKLLTATLIALGTICVPASVEAQTRTFLEDCKQYEVTETYTPGQIVDGSYSRGRVNYTRNRVESTAYDGGAFQHMNYYSNPYGSYQQPHYPATTISTTSISATTATSRSTSGTMSR